MLKNYLKIAWRNLLRNRVYSFINIAGLTMGLIACLLVASVVLDDLSYDGGWKNSADLYRVISVNNNIKTGIQKSPMSFSGLGPTAKKLFPEVKEYCRMSVSNITLKIGKKSEGIAFKSLSAEPSIWRTLDFQIKEGDPEIFKKGYTNVVITEKIKELYFPKRDVIGKIFYTISSFGKPEQVMITGVLKELPANTHLRADILVLKEHRPQDDLLNKDGGNFESQYLLLMHGTSIPKFTKKIDSWYTKDIMSGKAWYSFQFQPIRDVYLKSDFSGGQAIQGSMRTIYILSVVSILLLLIACINFVNLTSARALKRMPEAGIRKILGADKKELVAQFLFESLLFFFIAFVMGLTGFKIGMVYVEKFLEHPITVDLGNNVLLLTCTTLFVLLVGILSGLYPAFLVSSKRPVEIMKGAFAVTGGAKGLRSSLVVMQFVISICIMTAMLIMHQQLKFIDQKDLGYDKENLLISNFTSWEGKGQAMKTEISKLAGVERTSISMWDPSDGGGTMSSQLTDLKDKNNKIILWYIWGDPDLIATMKFQLRSGRLLNPVLYSDAVNEDSLQGLRKFDQIEKEQKNTPLLVTEYTAKTFDIRNLNVKSHLDLGIPVGIIKDFNNQSLHMPVGALAVRAIRNPDYGYMLIRLKPNDKTTMAGLQHIWMKFFPEKEFDIHSVSEKLQAAYKPEQKLQQLLMYFSLLIVFLACLGLFGLAEFSAQQRVKEIGIRKVLGATVASITTLLSVDFLRLVMLALLIATPIAWYSMDRWLMDFAYRVDIQWWVFIVTGTFAALIALFTISFQTIKAAVTNPVNSLRSE